MTETVNTEVHKSRLTPKRIVGGVIFGALILGIAPMALFPFRNWDPKAVASRFLKNCPEIKLEAGEVTNVARFERLSRSQEIARRLQAGESPFGPAGTKEAENSRFERLPARTTRETLRVSGTKREVEAEVTLKKGYFGDYESSVYYVVTEARYQDDTGNWIAVPIGWTDNYFLLFK